MLIIEAELTCVNRKMNVDRIMARPIFSCAKPYEHIR